MSCATIRLSATSPNAPGVAAAPATTQSLAGYTSMRIEAELAGATGVIFGSSAETARLPRAG